MKAALYHLSEIYRHPNVFFIAHFVTQQVKVILNMHHDIEDRDILMCFKGEKNQFNWMTLIFICAGNDQVGTLPVYVKVQRSDNW